jgi:hypothetical protein
MMTSFLEELIFKIPSVQSKPRHGAFNLDAFEPLMRIE